MPSESKRCCEPRGSCRYVKPDHSQRIVASVNR
jgi:hypothetical protein